MQNQYFIGPMEEEGILILKLQVEDNLIPQIVIMNLEIFLKKV